MEHVSLFYRFGAALAMGLLIGLQREYAYDVKHKDSFAGVRTFPLLSLGGAFAALAADLTNSLWPLVAAMLLLGGLVIAAYVIGAWRGSLGITTEVAAMLTIFLGALAYWEQFALAAALTVAVTLLLALKMELQRFTEKITQEDLFATLKFAVITVIILPVLPDEPLGPPPFDVLNLYKIWLMVVFISGISFLGYMLIKVVGSRQGIILTGFLGGMVSSTAVTLSFTQRSQTDKHLAKPFALAIVVAWTVMFSRVFIEVAVLNRELLGVVWLPMAASALAGLGYGVYLFFSQRTNQEQGDVAFSNPFELKPAFTFGLLYAVILLVSHLAQTYFGGTGVYISSILAGLTDVDAITLSMAELTGPGGGLDMVTGARAIVLAAMSNTAVKGGIALSGGSPALRKALLPGFILMFVVGIGVAFLM